ncbi:MAG: hypothetical protein QMC27_02895, partial [Flavobacteriaceae bacterium]
MNSVSLLKRIDTKFLTTESKLLEVLPLLNNDYRILEIEDLRLMNYATLYFDTEDLKSYTEHHNGSPGSCSGDEAPQEDEFDRFAASSNEGLLGGTPFHNT